MSKKISIYYDEQDKANTGWAYRVDGGESGAIDGQAADAVARIVANDEALDGDHDALRSAIGYHSGDSVAITGPGLPGSLGDLLEVGA